MVKKEDKKKTVLPFDDHDEFAFITTRYITIVSIFWFPFVIYVLLFRHPIPELPHFYYVSIWNLFLAYFGMIHMYFSWRKYYPYWLFKIIDLLTFRRGLRFVTKITFHRFVLVFLYCTAVYFFIGLSLVLRYHGLSSESFVREFDEFAPLWEMLYTIAREELPDNLRPVVIRIIGFVETCFIAIKAVLQAFWNWVFAEPQESAVVWFFAIVKFIVGPLQEHIIANETRQVSIQETQKRYEAYDKYSRGE